MKFVLIFGANGMLGKYLLDKLDMNEELCVVSITRDIYDALDDSCEKLDGILRAYKNVSATVINCIGIIPQKYNQIEQRVYIKVNTVFPINLSNICNKYSINMIHITTDCVFNGRSDISYNESSKHTETNLYGVTKSLGEPENCCVIRTSIVGEEQQSKKSLLEWVKSQQNQTINGFVNHKWNGVTCLELAKIIDVIITNNSFWKGVRHIFSNEIVSKYELVCMINDIWDLNISVNKHETEIINKTLTTKYNNYFDIIPLRKQLEELRQWAFVRKNGDPIDKYLYSNIL